MTAALSVFLDFEHVTCGVAGCGTHFALERAFHKGVKEHGTDFYCPRGHKISYFESDNQKLKKQLEEKERRIEFERRARQSAEKARDSALRSAASVKGKLKAQNERIKAGVCPCCKRTFKQLARHMECKHPNWKGDES